MHAEGTSLGAPTLAQSNVYFCASDGLIYSCPASSCGQAPNVVAPNPVGGVDALVPSGEVLYYLAAPLDAEREQHFALLKVPSDGSAPPSVVLNDAPGGDNLAVAANAAFWLGPPSFTGEPAGRDIYRCELPDCSGGPTIFAKTSGLPCVNSQLIADESTSSLYWLECEQSDRGIVKRCPFSGCESEPELVTPGPPAFFDFALTEHDLWLAPSLGSGIKPGILRRPR